MHRKHMLGTSVQLEKLKQGEVTLTENFKAFKDVVGLDYVSNKEVVDLVVRGLSRPGLFTEIEINLDMDAIVNALLCTI